MLSIDAGFLNVYVPTDEFISTWTASNITLPLESSGTYDFDVAWGDGSIDHITTYDQVEVTHDYGTLGNYTVTINGTIQGFSFNDGGDKDLIQRIVSWGSLDLGKLELFEPCVVCFGGLSLMVFMVSYVL